MKVEVCASNFESAEAALNGGAHRIELCESLAVGGLTPSRLLIKRVLKEIALPTHVLIRAREGDFHYTKEELNTMLEDIRICRDLGCQGIVAGALTSEGTIDLEATERLINASHGMHFTFHRAFDVSKDPIESLQQLNELGVHSLLSSGQAITASEGKELLFKLKAETGHGIEIIPAAGINATNVSQFKEAGFGYVHLSAIDKSQSGTDFFNTGKAGISNLRTIKDVVKLAKREAFGRPPGLDLNH